LLSAQEEVIRDLKRKKNEIKVENFRLSKEVMTLQQANLTLKEQLRELRV